VCRQVAGAPPGAPAPWVHLTRSAFGSRTLGALSKPHRPLYDRTMPNTDRPLPVRCPTCEHLGALLVVKSSTVMTATCARCRHTWATDLLTLPPEIQTRVTDVLRKIDLDDSLGSQTFQARPRSG